MTMYNTSAAGNRLGQFSFSTGWKIEGCRHVHLVMLALSAIANKTLEAMATSLLKFLKLILHETGAGIAGQIWSCAAVWSMNWVIAETSTARNAKITHVFRESLNQILNVRLRQNFSNWGIVLLLNT